MSYPACLLLAVFLMECEICGAEDAPFTIMIEGARMKACRNCSYSGKILSYPTAPAPKAGAAGAGGAHGAPGSSPPSRQEFEIVEGYGMLIRGARMKMHLPLSVLAEKLNEKESFLERVENNRALPGEKLAHHLEKELGIKLLEVVETTTLPNSVTSGKGGPVTLGDIIQIEKKKKK